MLKTRFTEEFGVEHPIVRDDVGRPHRARRRRLRGRRSRHHRAQLLLHHRLREAGFADTHASIGLLNGWSGSAMLPRTVALPMVIQIILSGDPLDAETALRIGLPNEVVSHDDGDAGRRVIFRVENDRDGRSYSARRVVAIQDGALILNTACSFRTVTAGAERTKSDVTPLADPAPCRTIPTGPGIALEARVQDWRTRRTVLSTKFWVRPNCTLPENDSLAHVTAIAYMTDFSAGLSRVHGSEILGPSLDHSAWFHRTPRWDGWLLVDYGAGVAAGKRGGYPGSVIDGNGEIVASSAQEMVYTEKR